MTGVFSEFGSALCHDPMLRLTQQFFVHIVPPTVLDLRSNHLSLVADMADISLRCTQCLNERISQPVVQVTVCFVRK